MKKIFTAVILAVFILSAQIAAADVDWNSAPRINSKAQLADYIEEGRRKGYDTFYVYITSTSILPNAWRTRNIDKNDFANIVPCRDYVPLHTYIDGKGMQLAFRVIEYPGTRVANAYLSRNQHQAWMNLTNEEQKLYNIAVGIVDKANKLSSEREKAKYIHDEICNRVKEFKDENERNKTAIGALIDGYAQCQGFTDAFYMLGRMCGLNVGRIFGTDNGGGHAWNWITFNNGKSYCIDVVNGFNTKGTYIFCANKERMEKTYWCNWDIIPNMQ
ncbi:MAG: transglutaminase domain-containing protein [Selenomonadaceae bacterium]|nr:transglutaminase domain-containing protein [Selenomonadaceae bacterium]